MHNRQRAWLSDQNPRLQTICWGLSVITTRPSYRNPMHFYYFQLAFKCSSSKSGYKITIDKRADEVLPGSATYGLYLDFLNTSKDWSRCRNSHKVWTYRQLWCLLGYCALASLSSSTDDRTGSRQILLSDLRTSELAVFTVTNPSSPGCT